jgi:OOP family OmpA-OmpF porin
VKYILVILFCLPLLLKAQVNLVSNPSFEDTVMIRLQPDYILNNTLYWHTSHDGTSDYWTEHYGFAPYVFSVCCYYARTGKAYAGFFTSGYANDINYREYVQIKLSQPLIAGKEYAVGYYYASVSVYSITHELGFRFSFDTLAYPSWFTTPPTTYYNHLGTNSLSYMDTNLALISAINNGHDTTAWYPLRTTYIATGGEEYLTIGNLYGADTTTLTYTGTPLSPINQTFSYFLVDDVYVLDVEQLQDTDLVYIDTFNVGVPVTYNCIENICIDPGDATGLYSTLVDCQAVCVVSAIKENNSTKQLLKITDVLGRQSKPTPNMPLFYRYDDGTVEKKLIIE